MEFSVDYAGSTLNTLRSVVTIQKALRVFMISDLDQMHEFSGKVSRCSKWYDSFPRVSETGSLLPLYAAKLIPTHPACIFYFDENARVCGILGEKCRRTFNDTFARYLLLLHVFFLTPSITVWIVAIFCFS